MGIRKTANGPAPFPPAQRLARIRRSSSLATPLLSIKKTHRAVVVQEQWGLYGIAAEISAQIAERAFYDLDAPVQRVTGAFVPMPYSKALETLAFPHEDDIVAAAKRTLYGK